MNIDADAVTVDAPSSPSQAIVMGIAERKGVNPTQMPPLYEMVDPEALDGLFQNEQSGQVMFEYAGYEVIVHGNGYIDIHEVETSAIENQF